METQTESQLANAQISKQADTFTVKLERKLNHPVQRVWQALTDPAKLSLWLANVELELRPGGKLFVAFTNTDSNATGEETGVTETGVDISCKTEENTAHGKVTLVQENAVIEYTWQWDDEPVSLVRWELKQLSENSCLLLLTHSGLTGPIQSFSAGWQGHTDQLQRVLDGDASGFFFDFKRYEERYKQYEKELEKL